MYLPTATVYSDSVDDDFSASLLIVRSLACAHPFETHFELCFPPGRRRRPAEPANFEDVLVTLVKIVQFSWSATGFFSRSEIVDNASVERLSILFNRSRGASLI